MRRKLEVLGATESPIDAAMAAVSRRTPADLALWATAPEHLAAIRELRRFFDEALGDEAQLHERLFRPALQQRFQELGPPTEGWVVSSRWASSARSWVWRKSCRPCCGQPLWAVCSAWAPRQPRCEP